MMKKILVPVDGSAPSRAGLERAIALAKGQGGRRRRLHGVDDAAVLRGSIEPSLNIGDLIDVLEKEGRRTLAAAEQAARRRGVKVETVLHSGRLGSVADGIVREARKWRADVIVMGTHGRRGFGRLVMGSDAESVVRESPIPVLLVKAKRTRR